MCPGHHFFGDLRHVKIAKLISQLLCAENISTFQIPMENRHFMKGSQTPSHVNEGLPDFRFLEIRLVPDVFVNFLKNVSFFCDLHDYTECLRCVVKEGFLVIDYVGMRNGC